LYILSPPAILRGAFFLCVMLSPCYDNCFVGLATKKMELFAPENHDRVKWLYRFAFRLAVFTIIYNIVEGIIAGYFGYEDESVTLFGFGIDSFIEAISGMGIAHMILRIWRNPGTSSSAFENTALRVTAFAFYILAAGLVLTAIYNIYTHHKPITTFWGVII